MQMKMVACIISALLFASCSTTQMYYIRNAEMIPRSESDKREVTGNRPEPVKHLLNGHYIRSGDDLVLLIRKFDKGATFAIDDESFEKLTIQIKNYTIGVPIELCSPDVSLYYSSGGSAWIRRGAGVYSDAASGTLIIMRIEGNKVIAEIDMTMRAKSARSPSKGEDVQVRDVICFTEKKITDLNPWLGVPDKDVGEEAYP